jgi:hypothetical protein
VTWTWLVWLAGWALVIDAVRRPAHQWTAADRNRTFWVALLTLMAPIFLIPYLVGVLPRLARTSNATTAPEFLRED